jgi:hypothetical protein
MTLALEGGEWSASRFCCFTPWERAPGINLIGDWLNTRADLGAVGEKTNLSVLGIEPLNKVINVS